MKRDVRELAAWVAAQDGAPSTVLAAARRLLSRPRRVERVVPAVERAKAAKTEAEAKRRAELDRIIPAIQQRSGGRCEWCSAEGSDFHHMLPGSQRRKRESVESMVLLCSLCHTRYHACHATTMWMALSWAEKHSTPEVQHEVDRRINHARAQHPGRETA